MITLDALDIKDRELLLKWNRDEEIRKLIGSVFSASELEHQNWFDNKCISANEKVWMIRLNNEETTIGVIGLKNIDYINGNAEVYIYIGEKNYWGKGLGTAAIKKILTIAFYNLRLHRIHLYVFSYNLRAIKSYEKIGFINEGNYRQSKFVDGEYYDKYIMGLLKEEYVE